MAITAPTLASDIFPPFNFDVRELSSFYFHVPSHTWDHLRLSYGSSESLITARGAARRQNRDIWRAAECGEDNVVKREKRRLPTMTKRPLVRHETTDICSKVQAGLFVWTTTKHGASCVFVPPNLIFHTFPPIKLLHMNSIFLVWEGNYSGFFCHPVFRDAKNCTVRFLWVRVWKSTLNSHPTKKQKASEGRHKEAGNYL